MTLQTTTRTMGEVIVVDCRGKIVLGEETAALRHLVRDLMNESRQVVLNLTDIAHIDSNGIGMLFDLYKTAEKAGAVIKLAGLGDRVKSVAEMTRLGMAFEFFPTVEEAASSFEAAVPHAKAG